MKESTVLTLIGQKLNKAIKCIESTRSRSYEIKEISNLLDEAYEHWYNYAYEKNLLQLEVTQDLYDLYDNLEAYFDYYEDGDESSLKFISDKIENILKTMKYYIVNNISQESDSLESCETSEESDLDLAFSEKLQISNRSRNNAIRKHDLGDGLTGYESDTDANLAEWKNANRTEQHFFSIDRNKKNTTHDLAHSFFHNPTTVKKDSQIIDSDLKSARALITADSAAVKNSFPVDQSVTIKTPDDIQKKCTGIKQKIATGIAKR